jgi:Mrp family chromosome partitioning ATPase/capsular polysaccharide biosynthesis protein
MLDGRRKLSFSFADADDSRPQQEAWRDGVDIGLVLSKLRERRRLLFSSALVGAAALGICGVGWLALRSTAYSAGTDILIANTTLQLSGQDAVVTQLMVENTLLQSQMLLVRSNAVMERAVVKLGSEQVKAMLPQPGLLGKLRQVLSFGRSAPQPGSSEAAAERNGLLQALKANVTVARAGASQVLSLRARGSSPDFAALLAQEVTQAFLGENRDINAVVTTSGAFRERIRVLGPTARVISEAVPPLSKDGPRALLVLLLGPLLGALLGLAAAAAFAVFSRRIWSGEQMIARTGAEFFGQIAASRRQTDDPLRQHSSLATALRRIRAAALERRGSRPRVIGVTALERGGKTTVATGLGLLLAAEGRRVLLVDAAPALRDLTRGLSGGPGPGLQQVLQDPRVFQDVVRTELRSCLDLLAAGDGDNDIDTRWPNLLKGIETAGDRPYDWVILDMPMLEPTADLRAALAVLDDLILVAERGRSSGPAISNALQALGSGRDKLMGTLINEPMVVAPPPRRPIGAQGPDRRMVKPAPPMRPAQPPTVRERA